MATSAERGRHVRQRLLRAAAELIAEHGWTAVSTRMLADRAGVAPGLVHYHFDSLQALLGEAAIQVMEDVVDGTAQHLAQAGSAGEGLGLMLADLDRYPGDDPQSRLVSEAMLAASRDGALRAGMAGLLERFRARLADHLAAHGVADPRATAAVLAAALDGMMLHRALDPELTENTVAPVLARLLRSGPPDPGQEGL